MIQLKVKTNTLRKDVNVESTETPASVIAANSIDTTGSRLTLNGMPLSIADMNTSFADLGIGEGQSATLVAVVKADGASK